MSVQSLLTAATRQAQSPTVFGESITIPSGSATNYTCTQAETFSQDFNYEGGGALIGLLGAVIISKQDLQSEPVRGTFATFRSTSYRITEVLDLNVNWEIHMIQTSD